MGVPHCSGGRKSMLAGSVKVVEESSNTTKRIVGSASPKGKCKKNYSAFIKESSSLSSDAVPWSFPPPLANHAACQMCSPQHLANRSYWFSSELDILHIQMPFLGCSLPSSCPDSVNSLWWQVRWACFWVFSIVWSHCSTHHRVQDLTCMSSFQI